MNTEINKTMYNSRMIETKEILEQENILDEQNQEDERLTNALRKVADKIAPQAEIKSQPSGFRTKGKPEKVILKPITRNILDELEYTFGQSLKEEVIKLETTLRAEVEAQPYKPITPEKKDEIVWSIVNYEKQQDTLSKILLEITELINEGGKINDQEITALIESSPGKKYLELESLLEKANFIEDAKKSIGTMYDETRKALVKYILSNKDILKLKDFFEQNNTQKQIDKVLVEQGVKNKEPLEIEKEALMLLGEFFVKTNSVNMADVIKIAESYNLDINLFKERVKELINILRKSNTNPARLERLVENILHGGEKRLKEQKDLKTIYLNKIAKDYKNINNLELAKIASEHRLPLSIIKQEANILIKRLAENNNQENRKSPEEITQEIADLSIRGNL